MQKPASLHIPKPCHENWNAMTTTQQGKFCAACSKEVIDFSLMSNQQILNVLAQQKGTLCGRFHHDQLERKIVETKVTKSKSLWLAFTLPFMVLFQKSFGQKNDSAKVKAPQTLTENKILMGKALMVHSSELIAKEKMLQGVVVDEHKQPIISATISLKGRDKFTITDTSGNFSLLIKTTETAPTLVASCIGYKDQELSLGNVDSSTSKIIFTLVGNVDKLNTVTITSYPVIRCHFTTGMTSSYRIITMQETVDSSLRKFLKISPFSVYPNPVKRGNFLHINSKKKGHYEAQLIDSKSAFIRSETYEVISDESISFGIPTNLSAGIYYLRIINTNTRKSYTEKLLIQ